jgi:hypothetical protein
MKKLVLVVAPLTGVDNHAYFTPRGRAAFNPDLTRPFPAVGLDRARHRHVAAPRFTDVTKGSGKDKSE